jgi:hypothetical protein
MWRRLKLLPGIAALVTCAACFDSPVPVVDSFESMLDARLFGTWVPLENESADVARITLLPFDEHQMIAEIVGLESADGVYEVESTLFRVLLAEIDGTTWISATELNEPEPDDESRDESAWAIARLDLEADGIVLFREVSHEIELDRIETVEGLQAMLVDRQDEEGFLDDEGIRFVRYDGVSTRYPTTGVVF